MTEYQMAGNMLKSKTKKPLELSLDLANKFFYYDSEHGCLKWKVNYSYLKAGDIAGYSERDGYSRVTFKGKHYPVHRIVWLLCNGTHPKNQIDHINGNRGDNHIENLREADQMQNTWNRTVTLGKSGYLGVRKASKGNKYEANMTVNGQVIFLGSFDTVEHAAFAYQIAKDVRKALGHPDPISSKPKTITVEIPLVASTTTECEFVLHLGFKTKEESNLAAEAIRKAMEASNG